MGWFNGVLRRQRRMKTRKIASTLLLIGLSLVLTAELCVGQAPISRPADKPSSAPATPLNGGTQPGAPTSPSDAPVIGDITLNTDDYPAGLIPQYNAGITFQLAYSSQLVASMTPRRRASSRRVA
jgi:hypothetical protein